MCTVSFFSAFCKSVWKCSLALYHPQDVCLPGPFNQSFLHSELNNNRFEVSHVHKVECVVPWLNDTLVFFTISLQLCQQLKDKVGVSHATWQWTNWINSHSMNVKVTLTLESCSNLCVLNISTTELPRGRGCCSHSVSLFQVFLYTHFFSILVLII